ncbi:hypothetical protein GCM10027592_57120 [Spirosoma flavus]
MANQDKKNRNDKKAATKAPKEHGVAKIPKYEQQPLASPTVLGLLPKAKKK